jgi:hypothetical protein
MLQKISGARHAIVGAGVLATSVLGGLGVVGAGDQAVLRAEHFDSKLITVMPVGESNPDGLRIREVVDIDFGVNERRGYQRIIPNDFGLVSDVTASSPDANDDVDVVVVGSDTRIRIGNPNVTFTGQRRYVVEYTLPDAQLTSGRLALDIIGNDETFVTDRFEVEVIGIDLSATTCDVGSFGGYGGCSIVGSGNGRVGFVLDSLAPGNGITITGDIDAVVDTDTPPLPPAPERNPTGLRAIGLAQLAVGSLAGAGVFGWFRRKGSNEVFGGGGAADAAFGEVPVPVPGDPVADVPTHRVPDSRLAELATVEFTPPRGVEPWQGNVLLREKVDSQTVSSWFSEMVSRGAIEITGSGSDVVLRPGQTTARLNDVDRGLLARLFQSSPEVELGSYNKDFTDVWSEIQASQQRFISHAGWWERPLGGGASGGDANASSVVVWVFVGFAVLAFTGMASVIVAAFGLFSAWWGAILLTIVATLTIAALAYWKMLASRTATGSALTLRTESFRRFLEASEGRHVEWAWKNGLLREYSAWAVALGAAGAWSKAIESSNIDHPEQFTAPLMIYTYGSAFSTSRTPPSSSGSGGGGFGGGFGGSVGGGGGGGSSGSW